MRRMLLVLVVGAASLMLFSAACGGGNSSTPTPAATGAATPTEAAGTPTSSAEGTPVSAEQLAAYFTSLRQVMNNTIAKANAGDVQGTRDAEGEGDAAMEAIIKALRAANSPIGDQLEQLELDYEHQADSSTTDVTVIAADAQKVLPLLDQAATLLNIGSPAATAAGETPITTAQLQAFFTSLRQVMNNTIAKANAGDVQGTRDAEGEGDQAMEAIIKALRAANSPIGDQLERLELDYEGQADSSTTDVKVIAADAQQVLPLLDQAATVLGIQ